MARGGNRVEPISLKHLLYGNQKGRCNGCGIHIIPFGDGHVVSILAPWDPGYDVANPSDMQLLCMWCADLKRGHSQMYLRGVLGGRIATDIPAGYQ